MTLWLVFLVMAAIAVGLLAFPLLRPSKDDAARVDYDVTLYRRQLDEIARDLARGVITPADVDAARAEIGRRLLAAAERRERRAPTSTLTRRMVAVVLAALVPLAALALYVNLGAPMVPDQPFASRERGAPAAEVAALEARIAELKAKLKANPKDVESWTELGHLYGAHERYREAADALGKAYELAGKPPARAVDFAEALVLADRGVVGAEAKALLAAGLAAEPRNPRAHFYMGLARVQAGDVRGGLEEWLEVEADSPPGAPWLASLGERIAAVAKDNAIDAATLDGLRGTARAAVAARTKAAQTAEKGGAIVGDEGAKTPAAPGGEAGKSPTDDKSAADAGKPSAEKGGTGGKGPSEADIEAAGKMSKEDQIAMVRGMVDRLAERLKTNPDDFEGWRRLGRSYMVLGEADKATDAYGRAAALAPKNVDVLLDYGEAILTAAGPAKNPSDRLPPKFLDVMRQIYALDDRNPVALWYLGVDHAQAGRKAEAAALWQRLLERLPPNAPERAALAKRLEMLKIDRKPEQ